METGKCFSEAVRRVIAIFQGNVNDFFVTEIKLGARKCQSSVTDIFAEMKVAHYTEYALKMEA